MKYWITFLLNLDALGGGLIYGAPPGIWISTWVGFKYPHSKSEKFINWLFRDSQHCLKSVIAQKPILQQYYGGV